jgi:hydroxymethylbilane synthase
MSRPIRVGTRSSELALWQATHVQQGLMAAGLEAELVHIRSEGDIDLKTPLYEMGVQGIFTRSLDIALLNDRIDIAVHSMKDVPTQLPAGISTAAVLERASWEDILVPRENGFSVEDLESIPAIIATSSTRRRAQWLRRFPKHRIESLRGNVNSRMQKLADSKWAGAIFAAAGLERIGLRPGNAISLDWMLPAPAQGAIMIAARSDDETMLDACTNLNHELTAICTQIEKDFLRMLQGGCTAPIGAFAQLRNGQIHFTGNLLNPEGSEELRIEQTVSMADARGLGERCGTELLAQGGERILQQSRLSNQ